MFSPTTISYCYYKASSELSLLNATNIVVSLVKEKTYFILLKILFEES